MVDRVKDELEPDLIIPFGISQKKQNSLYVTGSGVNCSDEIKKFEIDKIRGIYIPYWLASYHVRKKPSMYFRRMKKGERVSNYEKCFSSYSKDSCTENCRQNSRTQLYERLWSVRSSTRVPGDATRRLNDLHFGRDWSL